MSLLFSEKLLILPSVLIETLAGYSSLSCRPLLFITWNITCHSLLACCVSVEKPAASLIGAPLYVASYFSLAAFKILFISEFCHFNYDVSWSRPLWVPLDWDSLCFLYLCDFKNMERFTILCGHPCSGSMLIFSVLFKFWYMCC